MWIPGESGWNGPFSAVSRSRWSSVSDVLLLLEILNLLMAMSRMSPTFWLWVIQIITCSICTRELGGWSVLNVQRDSFGHLVSDTQLCWVTFREDRGCRTWWVTFMWLWSGKYLLLNRVFSLMFYYWMLNLLLNPFQFLNLKCVVHLWSSHF